MTRAQVIESAIRSYCAGMPLPTSDERLKELSEFVDSHLAKEREECGDADAVLQALKIVDDIVKGLDTQRRS